MKEILTNAVSAASVRAVITLAIVGAMIFMGVTEKEVGGELLLAFGTIIGFYFGTEVNGTYE